MSVTKKSTPTAKQSKAEQIANRLRSHHRLGSLANDRRLSEDELGRLNEYTLDKFQAFARDYSQDELNELCSGSRPNGLPLHWGYIPYLLAIQAKQAAKIGVGRKHRSAIAARRKFQRLAIDNGWSVAELRAAISMHFPQPVRGHGRRLSAPKDLALTVISFVRELDTMERRLHAIAKLAKAEGQISLARRCSHLAATLSASQKRFVMEIKPLKRSDQTPAKVGQR